MPITAPYAALLALLLVGVSIHIVRLRWRFRAPFGDAGQPALQQAIRAHGNHAEYAPLLVVLLWLGEAGGLPGWSVHALGAAMVVVRSAHVFGLLARRQPSIGRGIGTLGTFGLLILLAALLIWRSLA